MPLDLSAFRSFELMFIGHDSQIADLKKLADTKTLGHGYIFFGPDRVGKKTIALSLASYFETGEFLYRTGNILGDCLVILPDERKTIGIDEVRKVRGFLGQRPNRSPYRTVIIDNGECLTGESQNALLKISEDPPPSGLFIMIPVSYTHLTLPTTPYV